MQKYCNDPVKVTYLDVNNDGRDDYVIERQVNIPFVLIQQPDGTYKNIKDHLEFLDEKSEAQLEAEKSLIEKIVSGLKVEKKE